MGNCFAKCCGKFGRRKKYLQTRFTERKQSIEFENLMDDESVTAQQDMGRLITEEEQQLLRAGQYEAIVHEQCQIDRLLEEELAEQEEDLRRQEEAAYEAKREAARVARLQRSKEKSGKKTTTTINGARAWLADDEEWDASGDREEDFGVFLANVKARSLAARAQIHAGQGDCQSSSSSNAHTKDRSLTEGSSLDLEWDHEAGMEPVQRPRSHTEEILEDLTSLQNMGADTTGPTGTGGGSQHSSDLEWDDSFLTADDYEQRQLLDVHHWSGSVR